MEKMKTREENSLTSAIGSLEVTHSNLSYDIGRRKIKVNEWEKRGKNEG